MEKKHKIILFVVIGVILLGGAATTYFVLRRKKQPKGYKKKDDGTLQVGFTPEESRGEVVPPPPIKYPTPDPESAKYNRDDITAMQNYMLKNGDKKVVEAIDSTGGADGIKGRGFDRALDMMISLGKVTGIDDLYKKATAVAPPSRPKRYLAEGRYEALPCSQENKIKRANIILAKSPIGLGLNTSEYNKKVNTLAGFDCGYLDQWIKSLYRSGYDGFVYKGRKYSNIGGHHVKS